MRPKCTNEEVHVIRSYHAGKRARRSDQRYTALARATHRQTARDRIARHSGIAAYEQVLVQPAIVASRRLIVRAARPTSPSSIRTTLAPRRGWRCALMNAITSAVVTSL